VPGHAVATATRDAGILLGTPLERVIDASIHTWVRGSAAADDGIAWVGESIAGTGLASVVPHAERVARDFSASTRIGRGAR
jgi:oxygen-dependent protoporphyrinogen oxidase